MKKKLTHNLGLKLAALFCACCLWLICMNINDPVSQRVYTVSVQLLNMNTLTNAGKYVEVLDGTDSIRVTVRASRSVFSDFTEKNIVATADVSEMTGDNRLPIAITTTKSDSKIESIVADKEYVEVDIENMLKLTKPYDGVVELLKTLKEKGYKIAVVSNKYISKIWEKSIWRGFECCWIKRGSNMC